MTVAAMLVLNGENSVMIEFSLCLETVFTSLPPPQRIARIADAGFTSVEFWHPEATWDGQAINPALPKNAAALQQVCSQNNITVGGFVLNAWDGLYGGRPVVAEDRERYLAQTRKMIEFARAVGCPTLATLSGTSAPGLTRAQMRTNLVAALGAATALAEKHGMLLVLEPLNTQVDHPGYFLHSTTEAVEIIREINSPNLKLLYDIYHMQIMEGNILATIEQHLDLIGHFHAAAVPGRGEIYQGELNFRGIVQRLEALGYRGRFGLEFFPGTGGHDEVLRATLAYLGGEEAGLTIGPAAVPSGVSRPAAPLRG